MARVAWPAVTLTYVPLSHPQVEELHRGLAHCLNVGSILELDSNVQFSCVRATNFTGVLIFQ